MQNPINNNYKPPTRKQWIACAVFLGVFTLCAWAIGKYGKTPSPRYGPPHNYWVPTEEDKQYLDSLWMIVRDTKSNVDTINGDVERIIRKLDVIIYENGQRDSIKLYDKKHVENYNKHMLTIEQSHDYDIPLMDQHYKRDSIDRNE